MKPFTDINRIICGNSAEVIANFPEETIQLTVTSPPYDDLRDYRGFQFNWDIFTLCVKHLYRITKKGGVVVWVVGDATKNGTESGESFRQALYFMDAGFRLHDTMIYLKSSFANPSSFRYHQVFEYMFVFSKGKPSVFHRIKDRKIRSKRSGKSAIRLKNGTFARRTQPIIHKAYGGRFNVWKYTIGKGHSTKDDIAYHHPAIFPEKLARDHIYSWSNDGDIVLDPFCGSGTTCKMAYLMNRRYIGIDCSEEYCDIARNRIISVLGQQKPHAYWQNQLNKNVTNISIDHFLRKK